MQFAIGSQPLNRHALEMAENRDRGENSDKRGWFASLDLDKLRYPPASLERIVSCCTLLAIVIAVPAAALVIGWLVLLFVDGLTNPSDGFEAARNLGLILAAVIGLPFLIWRSWVGERQARAALRHAQSAEENVVTTSFTRAIDQLGATREVKETDGTSGETRTVQRPNLEVRLGALYALERLATTSKKDMAAIAEIIAAYLRENAEPLRNHADDLPQELDFADSKKHEWWKYYDDKGNYAMPREDVQAALAILCRSCTGDDWRHPIVDWSRLNGAYANLRYAMKPDLALRGARLFGALLEGADMRRTHLALADLRGANLVRVLLESADLRESKLLDSDLAIARLAHARLEFATVLGANLTGADLSDAGCYKTEFDGCQMIDAIMSRSDLRNATFSRSNIAGIELAGAIVYGADFQQAMGLEQAQIDACWQGDCETKLPPGIGRPEHWLDHPVTFEESESNLKLHRSGKPPPGPKS